ncbi:hypothetical protein D3C78_1004990 [compost metagenome]
MLALLVGRFLRRSAIADHRPNAGPGGQHVLCTNPRHGELLGAGGQQVVELAPADARVVVETFVVIEIGCADHRGALPGEDEHRSAVLGVHEAEGMGHRQPPGRQQKMAATQRTDALATSGLAQRFGPGAGGQGDGASAKIDASATFAILGQQATDLAVLPRQLDHPQPVERLAAIGAGLVQYAQHQPGIVGQRIGEAAAAKQAVVLQPRRQIAQLLARIEAMVAAAG